MPTYDKTQPMAAGRALVQLIYGFADGLDLGDSTNLLSFVQAWRISWPARPRSSAIGGSTSRRLPEREAALGADPDGPRGAAVVGDLCGHRVDPSEFRSDFLDRCHDAAEEIRDGLGSVATQIEGVAAQYPPPPPPQP